MNEGGLLRRLVVGLTVGVLLAGCAGGASRTSTPVQATPTGLPSAAATTPPPTGPGTATPAASRRVLALTHGVAYESTNPVVVPGVMDVYAPAEPGPWPVVVLFPAFERASLAEHARLVAALGFAVFVPEWGALPAGTGDMPLYEWAVANNSQGACALDFALAHAAEYGGDPRTLIVFGHSAGAHIAAAVTFARPEPSAGCLSASMSGSVNGLVTWEGDWLLYEIQPPPSPFQYDRLLTADPRIFDVMTPWAHLANDKDVQVVVLVSEDPNASLESDFPGIVVDRPVGDPWAAGSWLDVRDPSGDLRRQLEANGALADATLGLAEVQQLLVSVLEAQGNPASLEVMPDSSHAWLRGAGWDVFLAAFQKAAAED